MGLSRKMFFIQKIGLIYFHQLFSWRKFVDDVLGRSGNLTITVRLRSFPTIPFILWPERMNEKYPANTVYIKLVSQLIPRFLLGHF